MLKRGDTLIEVTLAIGIFSLVAVAAVAVLSSSTSSAQDTLEVSITREAIDAQADALRFIQSAAMVDHDTATPKFSDLWSKITGKAINLNLSNMTDAARKQLLQYAPDSCAENYQSSVAYNNAFIIDPNQLSNYANTTDTRNVQVLIDKNSGKLAPASTYPRLIYDTSDPAFVASDIDNEFSKAEGIYIVAIKDSRSSKPDYYDFYIRTCWYGTDSERPSTISTVIRLNDLDATKTAR